MKPQHLIASRMMGYGLTLADHTGWAAASAVWGVRLRPAELAAIAVAALSEMDEVTYSAVIAFMEDEA